MTAYVGIDLHRRRSLVVCLDEEGGPRMTGKPERPSGGDLDPETDRGEVRVEVLRCWQTQPHADVPMSVLAPTSQVGLEGVH